MNKSYPFTQYSTLSGNPARPSRSSTVFLLLILVEERE